MARIEDLLDRVAERYVSTSTDEILRNLYSDVDLRAASMLAYFHRRLNELFLFMNQKKRSNGHYNANESRELIRLIDEIDEVRSLCGREGISFDIEPRYEEVIDNCRSFLRESDGSEIPEDFPVVSIERYTPVFFFSIPAQIPQAKARKRHLQAIGEGAFAQVFKYYDDELGQYVALKRAKKDLSEKELMRFRAEFEMLKSLNFPYIVQAFSYEELSSSYTMEYCDSTLHKFISKNNTRLTFSSRKRIVQQFLYGVNYLHLKDTLHRDISPYNILIKEYDFLAVTVKLSDLGLHKNLQVGMTSVHSAMKGSYIDPTLESFKNFDVAAEIYAVGRVLSFVFSGKQNLGVCKGDVQKVVDRCTSSKRNERYRSIMELIGDVDLLHE